ncbi:MAG: hypothetical protein LBE92_21885 [Chryseobacterium sp.]|jgi:hypothetical protein|uniref:hypothetical protein n=1 Tax=Chryseobacterium sp. TaxID=1871047 RepID=UPI0028262A5B|nr:hypothetical protein [Chryseobacterium sp.]MDR2238774.1 hypothetical protein [Chryseobacterium sp.]
MKIQILTFLAVLLLCVSCHNEEDPIPIETASYDVYLGGVDTFKACYWKNGQQVFVQDGENIMGTEVIVDQNDVYLFGTNIKQINPEPAWYFWKNGVKHNVAQYLNAGNDSHFTIGGGITVHNGDIYFSGTATNPSSTSPQDKYQYCYWKNGVKTVLETYGDNNPIMMGGGLKIINNEVYVVARKNLNYDPVPTWDLGFYKNGIFHTLANTNELIALNMVNDPSNASQAYLLTRKTTGTNINAVKNITSGSDLQVPANIIQSGVSQLYFEGSDQYYVGKDFYYKNNTLISMNNADGFNTIGHFAAKDQNIYTTRLNSSSLSVKFYINDVEIQSLPDISKSCFNSIFVVKN